MYEEEKTGKEIRPVHQSSYNQIISMDWSRTKLKAMILEKWSENLVEP